MYDISFDNITLTHTFVGGAFFLWEYHGSFRLNNFNASDTDGDAPAIGMYFLNVDHGLVAQEWVSFWEKYLVAGMPLNE